MTDKESRGELHDRVTAIVKKWDDGRNTYRARTIILELRAALAMAGADEQAQRREDFAKAAEHQPRGWTSQCTGCGWECVEPQQEERRRQFKLHILALAGEGE